MIVDQRNQNSVEKKRREKNSLMRRPSSIDFGRKQNARKV